MARQQFDRTRVEVWRHVLASIAEDMGAALQRTAYSPNIKERLDHSCALFDEQGRLLAQAAHIPVHLGAMPLMMQTLRDRLAWPDGVMWLCNDPRHGGTHLPDLTLVAPVYVSSKRAGFVAARAHHADVGGSAPGSLSLASELFQEGIVVSPLRLVESGDVRTDALDLVCANSRTPAERKGDLAAQIAANETGIRRFQAVIHRYGLPEFRRRSRESFAYAEQAVRQALRRLPPGVYTAEDSLEPAAATDAALRICVTTTIGDGEACFDFTGTSPQAASSLNATEAITRSACYYVVRCLAADEIPTNEGCFEPVRVIAPEGTLLNPRFPAPVAAGNVETSQRIVDVLLSSLSQAAPDLIPAASQGTMNNLTIGGWDPLRSQPFAYYETLAGGAGADSAGPGASAIHTHMTNTLNTPIESLESHYPLRVVRYEIARGTGGAGAQRGGAGLRRVIELLSPATVSLLADRRRHGPPGAAGGEAGAPGSDTVRLPGEAAEQIPAKCTLVLPTGTEIAIRTPGGGGYGDPASRPETE